MLYLVLFFSVILFFNLVTLSCAYFVHQADDSDYSWEVGCYYTQKQW